MKIQNKLDNSKELHSKMRDELLKNGVDSVARNIIAMNTEWLEATKERLGAPTLGYVVAEAAAFMFEQGQGLTSETWCTALQAAAQQKQPDAVKALLAFGLEPKSLRGRTILKIALNAVDKGRFDNVRILFTHESTGRWLRNEVMRSAYLGEESDASKTLLLEPPATEDETRIRLLLTAIKNENYDEMDAIFATGPMPESDAWILSALINPQRSPLFKNKVAVYAAKHGYLDVVSALLSTGEITPENKSIALILASVNNHPSVVQTLLSNGPIPFKSQVAAMAQALQKGFGEIVNCFRAHGLHYVVIQNG